MEYNNRYSDRAQQRIDNLLSHADTNFWYTWLRNELFKELRKSVNNKDGYRNFSNRLQNEKEMQFIIEYFMSYKSTLAEVMDMCENPFIDEDVVVGLAKEREELIMEYEKDILSREWDRVSQVFPESWRSFARRRQYGNDEALKKLRSFLRLVDKISIITDILNKREGCYGLNLNYLYYNRYTLGKDDEENKMSRQELKKLLIVAIDKCSDFFWANTAMAVVFAICKEDYGFEDNASEFERFMQEVLKELKTPLSYGCPHNTIASAKQSGEYLKYPINLWQQHNADLRALRLLTELRVELGKAES